MQVRTGFPLLSEILSTKPLEWKSKAQLNEKHVKIEESLVARFGGQGRPVKLVRKGPADKGPVEGAVLMTRAF